MQYKCRTIPFHTLIPGQKGYIESLCDTCKSKDCDNPIENHTVSRLGVNGKVRCWVVGNMVSIVVKCEGYLE